MNLNSDRFQFVEQMKTAASVMEAAVLFAGLTASSFGAETKARLL